MSEAFSQDGEGHTEIAVSANQIPETMKIEEAEIQTLMNAPLTLPGAEPAAEVK